MSARVAAVAGAAGGGATPGRVDRVGLYVQNVFSNKPETRLNGILGLRNVSQLVEHRVALARHPGVIDAIVTCFFDGESELEERCQEYAIAALNNLLLEDPDIDYAIVKSEKCLPGLMTLLCSESQYLQLEAITAVDVLSIQDRCQVLVACEDGLLSVVLQYLHSPEPAACEHAAMVLAYLSAHPRNQFSMAREAGLLEEVLGLLKAEQQPVLQQAGARCLANLARLTENQVLISSLDGAVLTLVNLIDSPNADVRSDAKGVLAALSQNPACNTDL